MCHGQARRVFWGMGIIPPLIGILTMGILNPYYWVDDHPLLCGNNGSLDPGTKTLNFDLDVTFAQAFFQL